MYEIHIHTMTTQQQNIKCLFTKIKEEPKPKKVVCENKPTPSLPSKLTHSNPEVQEFYDQLSPPEIIAHTLAIEKLSTSYDVVRTHGFLRWKRSREGLK